MSSDAKEDTIRANNGFSPIGCQTIIRTNADLLLIGWNLKNKSLTKCIRTSKISLNQMHLKTSYANSGEFLCPHCVHNGCIPYHNSHNVYMDIMRMRYLEANMMLCGGSSPLSME